MPARPVWRGHLRLALVSCPVALYTVHRARGDLHFHLINPKTGNRVRMITLDAETDEELSRSHLVRGYEFEKNRFVVLEPRDFEKARIESSSVLTVDKFVDAGNIPPIYFDSSYYLAPDGEAGKDVYAVLREAIAESDKAALSRVVIQQRERTVAILPFGAGLVVHTLHEKQDISDPKDLFKPAKAEKPEQEMVKLALQLVERQTAPFEPSDLEDRYEGRLRQVIEAKLAGRRIAPAEEQALRGENVIDLMAALKQSVGRGNRDAGDAGSRPAAQRRRKAAAQHRTPRKNASRKRA